MKTTNTLALANTKFHRGKNLLSGIAIVLTTVLVFLVISLGLGVVNTQNAAVNKIYPTWHAMYRSVSEQHKDEIAQHEAIETSGVRQDIGQAPLPEGSVLISYIDAEGQRLNKIAFAQGRGPEKEHEAVLSKEALKALGYDGAKIGDTVTIPYQPFEDGGLSLEKRADFQLVGLFPDSKEATEKQIFSMMVAKDFMDEVVPQNQRNYRVMVRLTPAETTSTDTINEVAKEIGLAFGVLEDDIVSNSDYLFANYVDPAFYSGMAIIVVIILIAGALTIYSIYYVSLINKVQEFGKLKALGATKRQIRQIILKENLIVAGIAIPAGLVIGMGTIKLFFQQMMGTIANESVSMKVMQEVVENGEVQLILPWVVALTIGIALVTVLVASLRPMRLASKIMPIEAMRYTGQSESKLKQRKGFIDLTLQKLAGANLSRNKKRTLMTIFSLGLIGILFVVVSTVFSCMQPQQIARDAIAEDFRLGIESWSGDQMNPDREWTAIQQNNPLTEEKIQQIKQIPGVEEIVQHQSISGEIPVLIDSYNGKPLKFSIGGIEEAQMPEILKNLDEGSVTYKELLEGNKIIADEYFRRNYPQVSIGDQIEMTIFDGSKTYTQKMILAASGDFPQAIDSYNTFLCSNQVVKGMSANNLTNFLDIRVKGNQLSEVEATLKAIAEENEVFELESYEEILKQWQGSTALMTGAGYGIMLVLAIVGIMNLVNTTIDSILSRKKELGVMQAIGMSTGQMKRMLQMESLFYAGGIIFLSAGIGSVLGYFAYLYADSNGLMQIKTYHYPLTQVLLLIGITIVVQLLLTFATTTLVNKEPVITRIQASE